MDPLVNDKEELVSIVEALERDNLIMYAAEDNQIILIWEDVRVNAWQYECWLGIMK